MPNKKKQCIGLAALSKRRAKKIQRLGGLTVSKRKNWMAKIGRIGGKAARG